MKRMILSYFVAISLALFALTVDAATPVTENGVTTINLDEYNGYFAAEETLAGLKAGKYRFVVTNKAQKLVGFQLQDGNGQQLDMFPLEPGQTRISEVEITDSGFRYRCPINPTPWYEVNVK